MQRIRYFFFLLAALHVAGTVIAQKTGSAQKKESYKSYKSRSKVESASELLDEAKSKAADRPTEALNQVQEALGLSVAEGDVYNEGKSYVLIGEINEGIQEWKLARENYQQAYNLLRDAYSTTPEYAQAVVGLAQAHLKLANLNTALQYYQEALTLNPTDRQRETIKLAISEVYYQQGNYQQALVVLDEITGSQRVQKLANTRVESQKAKIYAQLNEPNKTRDYYQNSLNTLRSNNDPQEEQSVEKTKEEIAGVLQQQQRYDDEIDIRNRAIEYNLESKNLKAVAKDKVAIGKSLEAKGETSAALSELEEAARLADTLNDPREQANAFLALADLYEKNGRSAQALSTYKKFSRAVTRAEAENQARLTEKSELIEKQRDIEELTKDVSIGKREEAIQQAVVFRQQLVIYGLLFLLAIVLVAAYYIFKNAQASKRANQLLALKSLRSQMNPHFIFNALNSVNQFIARQDERTANKFLSEFSLLMRLVLENSQEDFIPLQKEEEIISLYLKLEHYRFRDKFDYEIVWDDSLNKDTVAIPPMLIQPYIENAIWHGLRYKETKGKLLLRVFREQGTLVAEITDDGIGRKRSAELKTENQKKHHSTGLSNIQERLTILNNVYRTDCRVSISDLTDTLGTRVRIELPVLNHAA